MDRFLVSLQMFWNDITGKGEKEKGATMVEYGVMVALIAVVVMLAVGPLGTTIATLFTDIATKVGAV
ncbi:Flp family type IVb pilin [Sinomonas mesophila]|uniref:Flp family type IVb pilin n=1 Tax=Sinomonas mesophila TaxID=1531955 RepID=UPI000984B756|nr:Flp family type IVb pilin [Sinomonas mesophila]